MLKPAPQQRWPVLIVGAGPVGMLLALLLAGRKIHSLLIEKRPGSLEWSKAIGITPPSLAILAKAGIDRTFITHGVKVTEAVVHDGCGIAGEVRFDRLASAYPFILTLPQSKTLEILAHALEASPYVEVRRSVELVTVSQTGGAVEVGLQATGGGDEKTIQAEWLIAKPIPPALSWPTSARTPAGIGRPICSSPDRARSNHFRSPQASAAGWRQSQRPPKAGRWNSFSWIRPPSSAACN
jgi:hypothetical protein